MYKRREQRLERFVTAQSPRVCPVLTCDIVRTVSSVPIAKADHRLFNTRQVFDSDAAAESATANPMNVRGTSLLRRVTLHLVRSGYRWYSEYPEYPEYRDTLYRFLRESPVSLHCYGYTAKCVNQAEDTHGSGRVARGKLLAEVLGQKFID